MTLESWLGNRWLKKEPTSQSEIGALLEKADRDAAEAQKADITPDWRLTIAYSASLGYATVALRAAGYRAPQVEGQHYRTIESLRHTIKPDDDLIAVLQAIRKKRNIVNYDASGIVSETEIKEAIEVAAELRTLVLDSLRKYHPELLAT